MVIPHLGTDTYALLTRPPLPLLTVRLACVRHAASVRSEPGSNSQVHSELHSPHCWVGWNSHELDPTRYIPFRQPEGCPRREPNMCTHICLRIRAACSDGWSVVRPTYREPQRQHPEVQARHLSMPWAPPTYPFQSILCSSQRAKPAKHWSAPSARSGVLGPGVGTVNDLQRGDRKNLWIVKYADISLKFPGAPIAVRHRRREEFHAACSHARDAWGLRRSARRSKLGAAAPVGVTARDAHQRRGCGVPRAQDAARPIPPRAPPAGRAGGAARGRSRARSVFPRARSAAGARPAPGNRPSPAPGPG